MGTNVALGAAADTALVVVGVVMTAGADVVPGLVAVDAPVQAVREVATASITSPAVTCPRMLRMCLI